MESLEGFAAAGDQRIPLGRGLDPLGDDGQIEKMTEGDDGFRNRRIVRVAVDVPDETAVNFDLVERKLFQITQGRLTGAEIVQHQSDAEFFLQRTHVFDGAANILQKQ